MDEGLFPKRKNNAVRILPRKGIFGGVCCETDECFLVKVPKQSTNAFFMAINENAEKENIPIHGNQTALVSWKRKVSNFKVNHGYNFGETGTLTHKTERLWGNAKWGNKKHRGTACHHLES